MCGVSEYGREVVVVGLWFVRWIDLVMVVDCDERFNSEFDARFTWSPVFAVVSR